MRSATGRKGSSAGSFPVSWRSSAARRLRWPNIAARAIDLTMRGAMDLVVGVKKIIGGAWVQGRQRPIHPVPSRMLPLTGKNKAFRAPSWQVKDQSPITLVLKLVQSRFQSRKQGCTHRLTCDKLTPCIIAYAEARVQGFVCAACDHRLHSYHE